VSSAPIIHLNGAPGVGKLTIGRLLAAHLKARLLDNHAIYDVALAVTDFRSAEFFETVRAVRAIAYDRVVRSPLSMPIVLTDALFEDSDWGRESWRDVLLLAERRKVPLLAVCLTCGPDEHRRRIVAEDRAAKRKAREPELVDRYVVRPLARLHGPHSLALDVTDLTADAAASHIADWTAKASAI